MHPRFFTVLVLSLASAATPTLSQVGSDSPSYCQTSALRTESGSDAYVFRDGNRCEGIYGLKLSGGSRRLVLLSLTSSRSDGALANQSDLEVSWPPLPPGTRLRISVVPINSPILYRMDTEVDGGTASSFKWPARIARRLFTAYSDLGVVASYFVGKDMVYVPCILGASGVASEGVRVDILSLESMHRIEVFSHPCMPSGETCNSLAAGKPVATLPAPDRDGTFTVNILSLGPNRSDFYDLRIEGATAKQASPAIATSLILRAPVKVSAGSVR